jgi:hypothetical protein
MLLTNSLDHRNGTALREANVRPSVLNRPSTTQMLANNSKLMDMLKGGRKIEGSEVSHDDKAATATSNLFTSKPKGQFNESEGRMSDFFAKMQTRLSVATESAEGTSSIRPQKSVENRKRENLIYEIQNLASHGPLESSTKSQLERFQQKLAAKQTEKADLMTKSVVCNTSSISSSSPTRLAKTGALMTRNDILPTPPKPASNFFGAQYSVQSQSKQEMLFFKGLGSPGSRSASKDLLKIQPTAASTSGLLMGFKDLQKQYPKSPKDLTYSMNVPETNSKYLALESRLFKDSVASQGKPRASSLQPSKNKESVEELGSTQQGSKASKVLSIIGDLERNRALNFLKSGQKSILCASINTEAPRKPAATLASASQGGNLKTTFLNLRRLQQPDISSQQNIQMASTLKYMMDQRVDVSATLSDSKKLLGKDMFKECSGSRLIRTPLNKSNNPAPSRLWGASASGSNQKSSDSSKLKLEAAGGRKFHIKDSDNNTPSTENLVVVKKLEHKTKSPSPNPGEARSPMWYVFKYGLQGVQDLPQGIVSTTQGLQITSFTRTLAEKLNHIKK